MSAKNIIIAIVSAIILLQALIFFRILPGRNAPTPDNVTITFWDSRNTIQIWQEILQNFHEKYPHITVNFEHISQDTYEDILVNRIAEGTGPDVFMLSNSSLFKHRDKIYSFPQNALSFSPQDFSATFVDGAYQQLVGQDGTIYGLPLFIDTPVLFYNKDILNTAGIAQIPTNWEDLATLSRTLTQKNNAGEIVKSGLAMGTAQSTDNSFEILSCLFLQEGDQIITWTTTPRVFLGEGSGRAIQFYTSFANTADPNYSWSGRNTSSLTAFAQEQAAFVIGFAEDMERIRAKNPHLNFGIMPFPQKKGTNVPVVYARYSFPTVLKFTKYPLESWQFVNYLAGQEGASAFLQKTALPPARRDIISKKSPVTDLGVFYRQSLIARAWPVPDNTAARNLFQETIDSVIAGTNSFWQARDNLTKRLELLLPK